MTDDTALGLGDTAGSGSDGIDPSTEEESMVICFVSTSEVLI